MIALSKTKYPKISPALTDLADRYQVAQARGRWNIVRVGDGHEICICRSHTEACALAKTLNQDCLKDPRHHGIK